MKEIPAGDREIKALIQLRNDMAQYISSVNLRPKGTSEQPLTTKDLENFTPDLPPPIDHQRACEKCPHLLSCSALQSQTFNGRHAMATLVPQTLAHLRPSHLAFFKRWCALLSLEMGHSKVVATNRALWCQDPLERERRGTAFAYLCLEEAQEVGMGQWVHRFSRGAVPPELSPKLPPTSLQVSFCHVT